MIEDLIELLEIQGVPQETKKNSQNARLKRVGKKGPIIRHG